MVCLPVSIIRTACRMPPRSFLFLLRGWTWDGISSFFLHQTFENSFPHIVYKMLSECGFCLKMQTIDITIFVSQVVFTHRNILFNHLSYKNQFCTFGGINIQISYRKRSQYPKRSISRRPPWT